MNLKSVWTVLALAAVGAANAQVNTVNSVIINSRVFNDVPTSNFTSTNNYPTNVTLSDLNVSAGSGWANRHVWRASKDGVTEYTTTGPDDTFEVFYDLTVTGAITPRKEAGFLMSTIVHPTHWPLSEWQFIVNSDAGEVVIFGFPSQFYSFNGSQGVFYTQGSTRRLGLRYYKDRTTNRYKFRYFVDGFQSPGLNLERWIDTNLNQDIDFSVVGLSAGTKIGGYLQVVNDGGNPNNGATAVFSNITIDPYPAIKGNVTLQDLAVSPAGKALTIEIRDVGSTTPIETITGIMKADGTYAAKPNVATGNYDIAIKGPTHLRKVVSNVAITNDGAANVNASLKNGDSDGDNEVGIGDYSILSGAYNTNVGDPGYSASADLNCDGSVDIGDYAILSNNYSMLGDD